MNHATIHLLVEDDGRGAILRTLESKYEVTVGSHIASADLCVVDRPSLDSHRERLQEVVRNEHPRFFPIVVLRAEDERFRPSRTPDREYDLQLVDDWISQWIDRTLFHQRIETLLQRRRDTITIDRYQRRQRQRFEALFDVIAEPAFIVDGGAGLVQVNDAFCELVGASRDHLWGRPLSDVIDFDDEHLDGPADGTVTVLEDDSDTPHRVKLSVRSKHLDGEVVTVGLLIDLSDIPSATRHGGESA